MHYIFGERKGVKCRRGAETLSGSRVVMIHAAAPAAAAVGAFLVLSSCAIHRYRTAIFEILERERYEITQELPSRPEPCFINEVLISRPEIILKMIPQLSISLGRGSEEGEG